MTSLAHGWRAYAVIGLIAAAAALAGIFTLPPLDRDESRFAQATAQMLETGDFISINFLEESRNKKPVGIHWLQAAAVAAFSDVGAREIWAYRLPSLLGAVLAAIACYWGGTRIVGREAAFAGAALFAACVMLGVEAGIAKTDAMLVGCTTIAMAALANLRAGGGRKTALLFWAAIGLGTLIKGPVAPMVAGLAVVVLIAWERRAGWLRPLLFWPGPLLALLIVLPWLIGIQIATDGAFLREMLSDELGPKIVSGHERHGGIPGYHLLVLPLLLFPATLFLLPGLGRVVAGVRAGGETDAARAARFLIAWAVPIWLVFEILPTKLPHYVLPAYPALALAAGWGFVELIKARSWQRWTSRGLFAAAGVIFAILLPTIFVIFGSGASWDTLRLVYEAGYDPAFDLAADPVAVITVFLALTVFVGLTGASLFAEKMHSGTSVLFLAVAAGVSWQLLARGAAIPGANAVWLADAVRSMQQEIEGAGTGPTDRLVTASSFTEPSLVFSLGTDTVLGSAEEVLTVANRRDVPTLVVLDLSRIDEVPPLPVGRCGERIISGTNYSRGSDVQLLAFYYPCPARQ